MKTTLDKAQLGYKIGGSKDVKKLYLIILEIPSGARVVQKDGSKELRCDMATPLGIYEMNNDVIINLENDSFENAIASAISTASAYPVIAENPGGEPFYEVGKTSYPDWFNDDDTVECSHGIHYYASLADAIEEYKNLCKGRQRLYEFCAWLVRIS